MKKEIKILCTGEIEVDYKDLLELQITSSGEKLKRTSDELINKLAYSIQKNGIINNLQVWQDSDKYYCFDAHHRQMALKKLEDDGWTIPLIPATRCLAKTKKEAQKLLLIKESKNSWIDEDVIQEYIDEVISDIDLDELDLMVNFDNIDLIDLENLFPEKEQKEKKEKELYVDSQYIIEVLADNEKEQEKIYNELTEQGYQCKVSIL